MRRFAFCCATLALFMMGTSGAYAAIVAKIDISSQRMNVYVNGGLKYSWAVSTGRSGYRTPRGSYRPKFLKRMHYSSKYNNSPMPHSIFFYGGYAIHGTNYVRRLGRRASHGCIRLHPANGCPPPLAERLHGKAGTRIVIKN